MVEGGSAILNMTNNDIIRMVAIGTAISLLIWWNGRKDRQKRREEMGRLKKMTPEEKEKVFEGFREVFKDPSK
jgi:flagellar motor switch protein FliG